MASLLERGRGAKSGGEPRKPIVGNPKNGAVIESHGLSRWRLYDFPETRKTGAVLIRLDTEDLCKKQAERSYEPRKHANLLDTRLIVRIFPSPTSTA